MFSRYLKPAAAAAILLLPSLASAQVSQFVECNPMEEDNCPALMALATEHNFNFNSTPSGDLWEVKAGSPQYDSETGARFAIESQGESTTLMSKFYFFWGRTEIWMKTAPGTGIVSSVMFFSDTLDEVDWEVLGSNSTHASSNFFGKGVEDWSNGAYHGMSGMHDDYHNYTTVWTEERLEWYIDGAQVRTLNAVDANNTQLYPQTPMRISLGIWAGGDPTLPEGTRAWAGGDTNYDEGPFYMYVKSVNVEDYSTGKQYEYTDRSGSMDSVNIIEGESESVEIINRPPPEPEQSLSDRWNDLSDGARTAIYAGAGAFVALIIGAALFYVIRQRRRGAREAKLAEQRAESERVEMNMFKANGVDPDSFTAHGHEYTSQTTRSAGAMGVSAYSAVPGGPASPTSPLYEKGYGAPVMAAAGRSGSFSNSPHSPHGSYRGPNPNPFASYEDHTPPTPRSAHSAHAPNPFASHDDYRSPSPASHHTPRMQTPNPPSRSFSGGPGGMPPRGHDQW